MCSQLSKRLEGRFIAQKKSAPSAVSCLDCMAFGRDQLPPACRLTPEFLSFLPSTVDFEKISLENSFPWSDPQTVAEPLPYLAVVYTPGSSEGPNFLCALVIRLVERLAEPLPRFELLQDSIEKGLTAVGEHATVAARLNEALRTGRSEAHGPYLQVAFAHFLPGQYGLSANLLMLAWNALFRTLQTELDATVYSERWTYEAIAITRSTGGKPNDLDVLLVFAVRQHLGMG